MVSEKAVLSASKLKEHRFFEEFSEKEIAELLKACTLHMYKPGDYVLRENETSQHIYIILAGSIRIGKILYAGDERELGVLGPGEFFGEISFLDQSPRSASALCAEETSLLELRKDSFERLAARRPTIAYKVAIKIARTLGKRLRESNDLVESIFSNPNKAILELKTRLMKIQTMLMRR